MSSFILYENFLSAKSASKLHSLGIPKFSFSYWFDGDIIHNPLFYSKNKDKPGGNTIQSAFTVAELLLILQQPEPHPKKHRYFGIKLSEDEAKLYEHSIQPYPEQLAALIISRLLFHEKIKNTDEALPPYMEINKFALLK